MIVRSPRPALGKNVNVVGGEEKDERNLRRWAEKRKAATLLRDVDPKAAARTSACGYVPHAPEVSLVLNPATGKAHFTGLTTCQSVWTCPICSPRIAAERKLELDQLLIGARAANLAPLLLTLTARHSRETKTAPMLSAMKEALRGFRQHSVWRKAPIAGSVTATEVTYGDAGPHIHYHVLVLVEQSPAAAILTLEGMRQSWLQCLAKQGLSGNHAAFQVQDASAAGAYVAKFGAAGEIALGAAKRGRGGSRTPWELLADATEGDKQAAAIWLEYAQAFKGRNQLSWSRGLKARFGISDPLEPERSADGDAQAPEPEPEPEPIILRTWFADGLWLEARRRRCALIAAAEAGTDLRLAEDGPPDCVRWRRRQRLSQVVEQWADADAA